MTKTTSLILLCLCLCVLTQVPNPGPRCQKGAGATCNYRIDSDEPGVTDGSDNEPAGTCRIRLYANGVVAYNRVLTAARAQDVRPTLSARANNNIDVITASGQCYCWVSLFNGQNYQGVNIGIWIDGDDEIYLADYRTLNQATRQWLQWDRTASSYWINCFFS